VCCKSCYAPCDRFSWDCGPKYLICVFNQIGGSTFFNKKEKKEKKKILYSIKELDRKDEMMKEGMK
jgi:hypothetical protein